jgi:hypothetical protein
VQDRKSGGNFENNLKKANAAQKNAKNLIPGPGANNEKTSPQIPVDESVKKTGQKCIF